MTIDHESIIEKKAKLQQAIRILVTIRSRPQTELEHDEIALGASMHYLTIGIEAILDIGSHILTEDFGASPTSYEDVITLLGQKNIINEDIQKQATGMGKFRNKMIHEYADMNISKIYAYLQTAPEQFQKFEQAFSSYLKKT